MINEVFHLLRKALAFELGSGELDRIVFTETCSVLIQIHEHLALHTSGIRSLRFLHCSINGLVVAHLVDDCGRKISFTNLSASARFAERVASAFDHDSCRDATCDVALESMQRGLRKRREHEQNVCETITAFDPVDDRPESYVRILSFLADGDDVAILIDVRTAHALVVHVDVIVHAIAIVVIDPSRFVHVDAFHIDEITLVVHIVKREVSVNIRIAGATRKAIGRTVDHLDRVHSVEHDESLFFVSTIHHVILHELPLSCTEVHDLERVESTLIARTELISHPFGDLFRWDAKRKPFRRCPTFASTVCVRERLADSAFSSDAHGSLNVVAKCLQCVDHHLVFYNERVRILVEHKVISIRSHTE